MPLKIMWLLTTLADNNFSGNKGNKKIPAHGGMLQNMIRAVVKEDNISSNVLKI